MTLPNPHRNRTKRLIAMTASLQSATSIAEVQSKLAAYHRERIETGAVFGEDRFRNSANRADRALIRDLKTVRHQLATLSAPRGMKRPELRHLHSLIGRAIFMRYLEDREILVPAYFETSPPAVRRGRNFSHRLLQLPPLNQGWRSCAFCECYKTRNSRTRYSTS